MTHTIRIAERGVNVIAGPCPACTTAGRPIEHHNLASAYSGERTYHGKQVPPPMSRAGGGWA